MKMFVQIALAAMLLLTACQSAAEPTVAPTTTPTQGQALAPVTATLEPTAAPIVEPTMAPATDSAPVPPTEPAVEPTVEPILAPTETATAEAALATTFCPDIPRPALILFTGEEYVAADVASGQSCELPIPTADTSAIQVANEQIYYHAVEDGKRIVRRVSPDGRVEDLAYTATDLNGGLFQSYLVSTDGNYIAWTQTGTDPADASQVISSLWIAETASGEVRLQLDELSRPEDGIHGLQPIRFSEDGSVLFFTDQPIGIGGSWMAFTGRYDNLRSIPVTGGEGTTLFTCETLELFLCIGDFYLVANELANLAYTDTDDRAVVVLAGDGRELNRLVSEMNYVGYPTFSPTAELVFYTASLPEDSIMPTTASLRRVAPPIAPAETVLVDPALILPDRFLDSTRLLVGYAPDEISFGIAVLDLMDGSLVSLDQWPMTQVVAVLP